MIDDTDGPVDPTVHDRACEALGNTISQQPRELVVIGLIVDKAGNYAIIANDYFVTRPEIYQAIGLLEQIKIDLLASVPKNRPLREPAPVLIEEVGEPIGQT